MSASSVFSGILEYIRDVFRGMWSIVGSSFTVLPYILRWGELRKEITEEYPDPVSSKTADDLPPRSRGFLVNDIDRCTGCKECEKICPAQCIKVDAELGPEEQKKWVSVFNIDFSSCMFCGLCVEVCQPASLTHTRRYEGATYRQEELVASFGRGELTSEQREKWATLRRINEEDEVIL